jgi:DNA-binding CsgD family transcriptional regulator
MSTFQDAMNQIAASEFTGRAFEQELFRQVLEGHRADSPARILNVYGTGGIGKTTLMERYRRIAENASAAFVSVDMRECMGDSRSVYRRIGYQLKEQNEAAQLDALSGTAALLNQEAERCTVVLAVDQYEEAGGLDHWLREELLPKLNSGIRIVIAGKYPLGGPWRLSPVWRKLILSVPLSELPYDEVQYYLQQHGIHDEAWRDRLWVESAGHPLTLCLLATLGQAELASTAPRRRTLAELLQYWLLEAPEDPLRSLVYAASVPRSFDQDLLQELLGERLPAESFDRLIGLSYVRPCAKGWTMHDLIREAARDMLRALRPDTFDAYRRRAAETLKGRIAARLSAGASVTLEAAELFCLIGNPVLRAHFRHSRSSEHYWESVTAATLPEAEHYVRKRRERPSAARIICADTESDTWFRYELTPEVSTMRLQGWQVGEVAALAGDALKLLRDHAGAVVGLSAIVPIHSGTMPYLLESPVSGPCFRMLPDAQLRELQLASPSKPGGRFIYAMDVMDMKRPELRSDIVHLLFEHIAAGSLLMTSIPAVPYYMDAHASLGFREAGPGYAYDDQTAGAVFLLDTRGDKLGGWIDDIVSGEEHGRAYVADQHAVDQERKQHTLAGLTPREQEVAQLLAQGATNREIAGTLYISEAGVKKHIQSMLQKTNMKNRTQFVAALVEGIRQR